MQNIREYVSNKKLLLKNITTTKDLKMVILRIGNDPASVKYTNNKLKDAQELQIDCKLNVLPEDITEEALLKLIKDLNHDSTLTGYLVQLPLPKHISEEKVKLAIDPSKDIDGFHPMSKTVPATPLGIYNYLKDMKYDFVGKNAVIIGRSNIVGKPMAHLLLNESMNVTVLHSKTYNDDKARFIKDADLIVVATGHPNTLSADWLEFKPSAIVIDVGINIKEDGKLVGDCQPDLPVEFQSPVPGGVGLLTRLAVIENLIELSK